MATDSTTSLFQLLESESGHGSRLFIGPMPHAAAKKSAPQIDDTENYWWSRIRRRFNDEGDEESVPDSDAFRFFIHKGGKREEWSSRILRKSVKRDMLTRLQQSGWTSLSRRKNVLQTETRRWVGSTFIIGKDFLGLPLEPSLLSSDDVPPVLPDTSPEPNVSSAISENLRNSRTVSTSSINNSTQGPIDSTTALLRPPAPIFVPPSSTNRLVATGPSTPPPSSTAFRSIFNLPSPPSTPLRSSFMFRQPDAITDPGTGRSVQFAPSLGPASPRKVLNRSPSSVPHTSAGASASRKHNHAQEFGDVIRRERMLVQKGYTDAMCAGRYFGATEAAKLSNLRSSELKEFLVVWRKRQLELYEDYSLSIEENYLGHKHLAYVIPLESAKTSVSLYSFIDLTFCLSCTELTARKGKRPVYENIANRLPFHRSTGTGTHLFLLKTKIRTSGIDWLWDLCKELEYDLPRTIEIHCPLVQAFVKLRIPENLSRAQNTAHFSVKNVVEMCQKGLQVLPSWDFVIGQHLEKGASLHLCWRKEAVLDWIQWETDLIGKTRDASILYGLCFKRPYEVTRLELRMGEHRPAYVTVKDAEKIFEPLPVEGYVYRMRLMTNTRNLLYLSVHSGCLFFLPPASAHPPTPPIPGMSIDAVSNSSKGTRVSLECEEKHRGAEQVLFSRAFIDLRKIKAVQRAFTEPPDGGTDALDVGGDEGLRRYPSRSTVTLRFRRSFVLLMENGRMVHFETHSCVIAQQWVDQLNKLVSFWKQRHREDAAREMKISDVFSRRMDIHYSSDSSQLSSVEPDVISRDVSLFWNRCAIYDCQPITLTGRLFVRRKLQGQYRLVQLVLAAGHLLEFDILPSNQNSRSWTVSLLDAYVCSGHFATQSLSVHEFSITKPPTPRRFQDGLQINDNELDLVFLIWYRPHAIRRTFISEDNAPIPAINAKHKVIVVKARSKLERDHWCWAVNEEVERIARRNVNRELRLHKSV